MDARDRILGAAFSPDGVLMLVKSAPGIRRCESARFVERCGACGELRDPSFRPVRAVHRCNSSLPVRRQCAGQTKAVSEESKASAREVGQPTWASPNLSPAGSKLDRSLRTNPGQAARRLRLLPVGAPRFSVEPIGLRRGRIDYELRVRLRRRGALTYLGQRPFVTVQRGSETTR